MSDQRHPDIEIYVKDRTVDQLLDWLATLGSSLSPAFEQGPTHEYTLMINDLKIPVLIHEKVAGKAWNSVWFKSDQTPWEKDIDCAKEASRSLETQVRCIAGGWQTGDDPDEWWKVIEGEATLIQWQT